MDNIFKKMSKITEEINKVAKNLSVGVGKSLYRAVGESDVLAAVKPIEIQCGIYSYPFKREIVRQDEFTTTSEYNGETKEKTTLLIRIKTTYRFVNVDNPEEYIDIETFGDGVDTQDKAPGKAMTYADKYALLKAYKIETGDDPDQFVSKEMKKITPLKISLIEKVKKLVTKIEDVLSYYKVYSLEELDEETLKDIIVKKGGNI